jgi:hypothetical protein
MLLVLFQYIKDRWKKTVKGSLLERFTGLLVTLYRQKRLQR